MQHGVRPDEIVHLLLNMDETGLVWKSIPKRTYKKVDQVFMAKKDMKDRVTILLGTSMDGSLKLKPLVIGKAQRPRAFSGDNIYALQVNWYGQKNVWMIADILKHWFLFELQEEIIAHYGEHWKVILSLDNAGL